MYPSIDVVMPAITLVMAAEVRLAAHMDRDPSHIMQVGMGFWPSKILLSAVELELFTHLGAESRTGAEIGAQLGLHPRGIYDFLDSLVALRLLEREGQEGAGSYRNTSDTATFLDKRSPAYL